MANFTVVYDANVLYPAPLRDLLMRLALTDLFRARWTNDIHDEWIRNVLEARRRLRTGGLLQPTPPWGGSENVVKNSVPTGTAFMLRGGGVRPVFKRPSMSALKHLNFQYNFLPASANLRPVQAVNFR